MIDEIDTVYLDSVKMDVLDGYLAKGWFRMHETVFTTQYFEDWGNNWRVYWLRYKVKDVCSNRFKQFRKNEKFSVTIRPLKVRQEIDELYTLYALNVTHDCQFELMNVLGPEADDVFDSQMIEIRDGKRLIAVGIFDKGKDAIAGITNFYHPEYSKYSLGKYLIYLKYRYCLEQNINYYYPGYFSIEMSKFDYKLFLDKNASEVFIPQDHVWIPYDTFQMKNLQKSGLILIKDEMNMLYKQFTPLENYYNFDESYDPISVYLGYFRELPNIKYLPGIHPEKSLNWIKENLKDHFHCEHKQEKYQSIGKGKLYGVSLFIFTNRLMISKEQDDIRIYYPPALEPIADNWVEGLMRFPVVKKRNSEISLVTTYKHGLDTTKIDLKRPRLVLKNQYNDDLLIHHPHILKSLRSTDTCGLFLFHGEPGTGKSTYIRFLIHQLKKKVIFITSQVAQNLDSPGMTMLLMENRNAVFVIEDAEELLVSRNLQTQSGISMLLNLSDGILGESLGIQIIATFNTPLHNIDPALLRKGRLKMRYEFKPLSTEKSRFLLLKLGKLDCQVTQPMTLAEIYHSGENDYKWQEQKNRIGFK